MVKIAIVEDEQESVLKVKEYIARFSKESGQDFDVTVFTDGIQIAENYRSDYDVIFLDVLMPHMDGMETAKFIRKLDKEVILIFITNMAQYAIKGYSVDALDFLLKPVSYFAFSEQLKRCVERLADKAKYFLLIPTENGLQKIEASKIYYIESFKHQMTVHSKLGVFSFSATMKELEEKLNPAHFFRCNNCYLVNLFYVSGVKDSVAVVNGDELAISRPRKKMFMEALVSFVGNGGK